MRIRANDLLYFSFHEGFTKRLLSGELRLKDSGILEYVLKRYPDVNKDGTISLNPFVLDEILGLLTSRDIHVLMNEYNGGWDDMGSSFFEFQLGESVKSVQINEIIDRQALSTDVEKLLFGINDKLILICSDLIST